MKNFVFANLTYILYNKILVIIGIYRIIVSVKIHNFVTSPYACK